jgi:N-ethylmaleimide reductase
MSRDSLFTPLTIGKIQLPNRIIMALLTRMRSGVENVPTALNANYYVQRASAGLIIAEGTAINPDAHGYPNAPGICTAEQIAGWRVVTDSVHARGGRIIMQIAHNGRNSHSSLRPDGSAPVAPSAIP